VKFGRSVLPIRQVDPLGSVFADRRHLSTMPVIFMITSVEAIMGVENRVIKLRIEVSSCQEGLRQS